MNDLAPVANACWARAATERFDIAGELELRIAVASPIAVDAVRDTTRSPELVACMHDAVAAYPFAPPLRGQIFQLPFKWSAPDGQSVIDRRLVAWHGQGKISIATLVDESNTGNAAAAMLEVAIAAGGSTGKRFVTTNEVWYFLGPAHIDAMDDRHDAAAGDMLWIRRHNTAEITATDRDVHAVVVIVPGGREGTARAGALMNDAAPHGAELVLGPRFLPVSAAHTYGPATIYIDPDRTYSKELSASILQLPAGATVAEHVHAHETELLYILAGAGAMTVAGTDVPITSTSVVQIPPNTPHAFRASEAVRALQIYTPAGPEQRFKKPPP